MAPNWAVSGLFTPACAPGHSPLTPRNGIERKSADIIHEKLTRIRFEPIANVSLPLHHEYRR